VAGSEWFDRMKKQVAPEFLSDPMMAELVDEYLEELPEMLGRISAGVESGELEEVQRLAHQIKGSAGTFGLAAIGDKAGELEAACKRGEGADRIKALASELMSTAGLA